MKRIFCFFLLFVTLFQTAFAAYDNADEIVYVTNYGECYHEAGCGYLHSSQKQITLEKAVNQGYRACSRCNPPRLSSTKTNDQPKISVPSYDVSNFSFSKPEYYSTQPKTETKFSSDNSTNTERKNEINQKTKLKTENQMFALGLVLRIIIPILIFVLFLRLMS
jgi:hypothetical protein